MDDASVELNDVPPPLDDTGSDSDSDSDVGLVAVHETPQVGVYVQDEAVDAVEEGLGTRRERWDLSLTEFGSDPDHDAKAMRNSGKNHHMRVRGYVCGHRTWETLWDDVDEERRAAVRSSILKKAIVARNKFDDADARAVFERCLAKAALSRKDRKRGSSWVIYNVGPEQFRNASVNHP